MQLDRARRREYAHRHVGHQPRLGRVLRRFTARAPVGLAPTASGRELTSEAADPERTFSYTALEPEQLLNAGEIVSGAGT